VLKSEAVGISTPSQLSLAVGEPNTGDWGHSKVTGPSVDVQKGALVSSTVMVSDVVAVLLHASVAVHVRVTL
jgi:hypothetical protein